MLQYRFKPSFWRRVRKRAFPLSPAAIVLLVILVPASDLRAHGIAGNRFFAGTLTFDDPAVADEAILPLFSYLDFPTQDSNVSENRIHGAFDRLLTPTLAFTVDSGWVHQNWPLLTSQPGRSQIAW
jgi:hypothetical protein